MRASDGHHLTAYRPAGDVLIDGYVRDLGRRLHGPAHAKRDLLTEVRDGLTDAVEGYREGGLPPDRAEELAMAEFGPTGRLAAEFQAELAAFSVRTLAVRIALVTGGLIFSANLMWQGAPWTGPRPPATYLMLSSGIEWLGAGCAALALVSLAWLTVTARRGRPVPVRQTRLAAHGLTGSLALHWLGGLALYGWSVHLWTAALTWPPMIIGMVLLCVAYGWLGTAARRCLAAARPP
ncbi:permease prefix domain 1-containing protein, partial [Micromonospora zhanjiangensis]